MSWENIIKNDGFPEWIRYKLDSNENLALDYTQPFNGIEYGVYTSNDGDSLDFTLEEAKRYGKVYDDWVIASDKRKKVLNERKREEQRRENQRLAELRNDPNSWEI